MKPAPFGYLAPRDLSEAAQALSSYGDDAKVLAGGQSLGPLLNLRLATPAVIIDVNRVAELATPPCEEGDRVTIGATVRHRDAERSPLIADSCPLLGEALPFIAHPTIRNRGTLGGSLAHADPAAELPAAMLALDAQFTTLSVRGTRTIPADGFFQGYFTTALEPDELLVSVSVPARPARTGSAWQEFAPRKGDFALVGVAATIGLGEQDAVANARLVYSGIADAPRRCIAAERVLVGGDFSPAAAAAAADEAAAAATDAPSDLVASSDFRRHLVRVLTERALISAHARAQEG